MNAPQVKADEQIIQNNTTLTPEDIIIEPSKKMIKKNIEDINDDTIPTLEDNAIEPLNTIAVKTSHNATNMTTRPHKVTNASFLRMLHTTPAIQETVFTQLEHEKLPEQAVNQILAIPHKSQRFQSDYEKLLDSFLA